MDPVSRHSGLGVILDHRAEQRAQTHQQARIVAQIDQPFDQQEAVGGIKHGGQLAVVGARRQQGGGAGRAGPR